MKSPQREHQGREMRVDRYLEIVAVLVEDLVVLAAIASVFHGPPRFPRHAGTVDILAQSLEVGVELVIAQRCESGTLRHSCPLTLGITRGRRPTGGCRG